MPESRVGVLFVHGIGEQLRGSLLFGWGEALAGWYDNWLRGAGLFNVRQGVPAAELEAFRDSAPNRSLREFAIDLLAEQERNTTQRRGDRPPPERSKEWLGGICTLSDLQRTFNPSRPDVPAHGTMTLDCIRRNGTVETACVRIAEAHWADAAEPPTFGQFVGWITKYLPLILQAHLAWGLCQARMNDADSAAARVRRVVEVFGWYVASLLLPAVPLFLLALLILSWPLALVPFAPARNLSKAIRNLMVSVVGDSYVLLEHPARAAAIRQRVTEALNWMVDDGCNRIVVVAHSQGAAIALDTLVETRPPEVVRLVTLGSGARKLAHLRAQRAGATTCYGSVATAWLAVGVPLLLAILASDLLAGTMPSLPSALIVLAIVAWFGYSRWTLGGGDRLRDVKSWRDRLESVHVKWLDLYASNDPVPNGAHALEQPGSLDPDNRAREVRNLGSLLSDHTSYWTNRHQVVAEIARVVGGQMEFHGSQLPFDLTGWTPADPATLDRAWRARRGRVAMLRVGRTVIVVLFVHLVFAGRMYLQSVGRWSIDTYKALPFDLPEWFERLVNGILELHFGLGRDGMAGLYLVLAATAAFVSVWTKIWTMLDAKVADEMFERGGRFPGPPLDVQMLIVFGGWLVQSGALFSLFRYLPPPRVLSPESAVLAALVLFNLSDVTDIVSHAVDAFKNTSG